MHSLVLNLAHVLAFADTGSPIPSGSRVRSVAHAIRPGASHDPEPHEQPSSDTADASVARRIRMGDEDALSVLFQKYAVELAIFVDRYVRDAAIAEEIVQDVFFWIVRNRAKWSVRGTVRAYLYGAARNRALDHLKHRNIEQRWAARTSDISIHSATSDVETQLISDERIAALVRAIGQLPESRRTALRLRWVDNMSYAEIAAVLGSSTKSVENQLNRTLRQLQRILSEID